MGHSARLCIKYFQEYVLTPCSRHFILLRSEERDPCGFRERIDPTYSHACRKRRLKGLAAGKASGCDFGPDLIMMRRSFRIAGQTQRGAFGGKRVRRLVVGQKREERSRRGWMDCAKEDMRTAASISIIYST